MGNSGADATRTPTGQRNPSRDNGRVTDSWGWTPAEIAAALPHPDDEERDLLAGLLNLGDDAPGVVDEIAATELVPDHFESPGLGRLYGHILKLRQSRRAIHDAAVVGLAEEAGRTGGPAGRQARDDALTALDNVRRLGPPWIEDDTPLAAKLRMLVGYARTVGEAGTRRRAGESGVEIVKAAVAPEQTPRGAAAFFLDEAARFRALVPGHVLPRPEEAGDSQKEDRPRLRLTSWADLEAEEAQWSPGGTDAVGTLNVIAGDGGIGKTKLTMSKAAAVSRGQRWPFNAPPCTDGVEVDLPRRVLFSGSEDRIKSDLLPAFLAAGGDKRQVASIDAVTVPVRDADGREIGFGLNERAMDALEAELESGEFGLVLLNEITGLVEGEGTGETVTRRSLNTLTGRLQRVKYPVVASAVMHFGKGIKRAKDKLIQSVAFYNIPRTIYYVLPDPTEVVGGHPERPDFRRLVFCEKRSGGVKFPTYAYRITDVPVPDRGFATGAVAWDTAPDGVTLNEALAAADALPEQAAARGTLPQSVVTAVLAAWGGWAPAQAVYKAGEALGIPERTLRYAKDKLGVRDKRFGVGGPVWWGLPDAPETPGAAAFVFAQGG